MIWISPNDQATIRLASAPPLEQNGEWLVRRRYLSAESMAIVLSEPNDPAIEVEEASGLPPDPTRLARQRRS